MRLTANGGRQYIFRQPTGKTWRCTTGALAPKVDTRANGGYIVVAPSVLSGQRRYRWAPGMELDQPPGQLPEPPIWLVDEIEKLATRANNSPRVADSAADANKIPSGQRNSTLASLAGTMRRVGMSPAEIRAALAQANTDRCVPPISPAEVDRIASSVCRYEPNQLAVAVAEDHWRQISGNGSKPPDVEFSAITSRELAENGHLRCKTLVLEFDGRGFQRVVHNRSTSL